MCIAHERSRTQRTHPDFGQKSRLSVCAPGPFSHQKVVEIWIAGDFDGGIFKKFRKQIIEVRVAEEFW